MKQNIQTKPRNKQEKLASQDLIIKASQSKIKSRGELLKLHKKVCEKYKINFITNPILLSTYNNLVKKKKIKGNNDLFQILRKRRVRTASGIASVAVLTKPFHCPGQCIYCPTEKDMPKSYLSNEPAVMRAVLAKFDPYCQVQIRLRGLEIAGNPTDKIELIIMGGTWSALPKDYQLEFIYQCFRACNEYNHKLKVKNEKLKVTVKNLKLAQKKNENAKCRIVGLTLETRPDFIHKDEVNWMRELGCTRVELGVQSIYDRILNKNKRGHLVSDTMRATKLLKDAGFKVCYHMMPNLYGSNKKLDLKMFKELFNDSRLQPDLIKIYPCVVTKNSQLYSLYKRGLYKSYSDKELTDLILKIKKLIPPYVRIQRLIRDIPKESIESGSKISNLRQIIQQSNQLSVHSSQLPAICQCIRCREIREEKKLPVKLSRIDYDASDGKEIFLQYIDKNNRLYALLRLRITSDNQAIIREVHTYGQMVSVGQKTKKDPQHSGLGKKLIREAEKIAKKEFKLKEISVISGVGVRNYYRRLNYKLCDTYMVKDL